MVMQSALTVGQQGARFYRTEHTQSVQAADTTRFTKNPAGSGYTLPLSLKPTPAMPCRG